ncbi:MAG TPA: Rnf-Nqr domain containing protein [Rhodanobacteraceae bacterium]|nr:Rnf-Nqr domain containing protein [Rhodanobacteraceae bacterium]
MTGFIAILIGAAMANNAALSHLLGLDPALRTGARLRDAGLLGLITGCILLIATATCWLIEHLLLAPFGLNWLRILVWLLVVAALAPWPRMLIPHRTGSARDRRKEPLESGQGRLLFDLGDRNDLDPSWALLLVGNGLVLGALALSAQSDFMTTLARSFGIAAGFGIVLLLFTAMHDRLEGADVPAPFRGLPILLISAAIMALGFMGFAGFGR